MNTHALITRFACALVLLGSTAVAADPHDALTPVKVNFSPGPEYGDSTRIFQGIPGMERAANGRLWALWYAGGPDEPGEGKGNYVMLVTRGDDGKSWSGPRLVIDPPGDVRAYDPTLWHDPQGRLWLFWAQSSHWWDGRSGTWAIVTENSGDENPRWSEPQRLCNGIMMNKPTVRSNGEWLLPVSMWAMPVDKRTREEHRHNLPEESGAQVVISRNKGHTFAFLGKTRAPENIFDEHMVVERKDGSLWMLIRTKAGIAESISTDGGKTWTPGAPSKIPHVNSRFFIRRLNSGKLLLVRHNPPDMKTRSHLTAWLSDDDGITWTGGLMLDERKGVSYPDGVQNKDGVIRIIYDFERTEAKQILMAAFTEADVAAGKPSDTTRLRVQVNQSTAISPKKKEKEPEKKSPSPAKSATTSTSAASAVPSPDSFGITTLTPPVLNTNPGPRYWPRLRMWQGIPGIERSPNGRLWATWYTGPLAEGSEGNHAVLVTSEDDGKTWTNPVAVYDASLFFSGNTGDPHLWVDPKGQLWWFVYRNMRIKDANGIRSLWGFRMVDAESATPQFHPPVFAGFGVGLNKATVLANGDWIRPIDNFNSKDPERTLFYVSRDQGASFTPLSKARVKDGVFSEHQVVQRKDGSLIALVRTSYGIGQIESFDNGATWVNDKPFTTERGVNTRFFFTRLKSGNWLLVVNDVPKGRSRLTAMLSEDEGKTWPHKLLLDDRQSVSYPDGTEGANGCLYITYDCGRYTKDEQEILFAKITEADIKAGKLVNEGSRLRQLINRLADHGGGVRETREPQLMEKADEVAKGRIAEKN
ncbi:sialidase family protein [Roseimicrobium sp. ORNL1]|uniref:sialidase family protein n=1 Tax=Roseimicrobium sp. ORNL1 TaxID=2711231 RepID=UPI0013E14D96|nr:sialidase family protein [Roseimicrobium sp. ORNL1]QIF03170.1 exo-alpha-sialidase [Roseimicrobium sp. ORNL1]